MVHIAIIGGTGVYNPGILNGVRDEQTTTPYGAVTFKVGEYAGKEVAFLPRHGSKHSIPPHLINYRANIWALKKIGVRKIIATTAVGSLNTSMEPGDFVLADQFLDFTKGRARTFYEGGARGVAHVDMTRPYCPRLAHAIRTAGNALDIALHGEGVYVCTEGPRFETAAEIKLFAKLGGDIVGMTSVPEAVLAREAEMCYATVSMVTNYAAGISLQPLTHQEVVGAMRENAENLRKLIMKTIEGIDLTAADTCHCHRALAEYGGFML